MAKHTHTVTVEMTEGEVIEAIRDWLKRKFDYTPITVSFSMDEDDHGYARFKGAIARSEISTPPKG